MGLGAVATQLTTPASASFVLRIGGRIYTGVAPVPFPGDDGSVVSCTIRETSQGSTNQMTWTLEDASGSLSFDGGEEVELVDLRSGTERLLFGGHLVEVVSRRRMGGQGRMLTCTAMGFDAWLDWRVIPSWSSKTNKNGRVTKISSERAMVQQVVNRFGGRLTAPSSLVINQNTDMDVVHVRKVTLRELLDRIAETATYADDEPNRYFYVDHSRQLHWYRGSENLTAPYRIGDGSYIRTVLTTSGLVSLWPMRAPAATTEYDSNGYANGTYTGSTWTAMAPRAGVPNEKAYWSHLRWGGTDAYISATGANLHPGDTFSIEFWFRRSTTGTTQTVWSGGTGDVEVGFTSADKLVVYLEGTGNHFVSDDTYTSTTAWVHVVVARSPGNTDVYVNGAAITGTTTARTFAAGSGTINIGRRKSSTDRYYIGALQAVAIYSSKLSAATALAHYNQGVTITPEGWEYTLSAFDGREAVYVSGGTTDGTGWVRATTTIRSRFGAPNGQPERQEVIDRDDAEGPGKKRAYGRWFLKANNDPVASGSFTVTGFDGWRVGQRVYVTSVPDGLDGYATEVQELETDVGMGAGVLTHTINWGKPKWSGARAVARGKKRGR